MRILHINSNYITSPLHQVMMKHFHGNISNEVFVPTYHSANLSNTLEAKIIVEKCFEKWDRLRFFNKQRKIINKIEEKVDLKEIDCIHAHTLFTDGNAAFTLSQKYNKPYIVTIRNTDVNIFFKYMIHLRPRGCKILKNAGAVTFLSQSYKDTVINSFVPVYERAEILNKSYVIPNGIDDFWLDNISPKNTFDIGDRICNSKEVKLIFVGGIDANKNVELTLKALKILNSEGWKCTLSSIGKVKDHRVFSKLESYDCFKYIPPKNKEELIDYYRDADIFVMPSHKESFGLVYAEAMSQGLPVIYSRGQGFDKQFEEGIIGYSVNSQDANELIERIKAIIDNYAFLSNNCINKVKKFNWQNITEKYVSIYERIIHS